MTSHYTGESVTTRHDFGGVLGRPLKFFFWALTIFGTFIDINKDSHTKSDVEGLYHCE